ncbi:trypsin-like peptidase domain-containing protein [Paraburkholderia sp. Ac-20340]|uniref:trypsin-like peptidase domain-containing protein n=1 Tax=Paraburkholderia sp. Ac-20340 TaxID=2703888 RepID=UPI0032168D6A
MPRPIPACTSRPAAALAALLVGTVCLTAQLDRAAYAATPAQASDESAAEKTVAEKPATGKHPPATPSAMAAPDFFSLADRYGPAVVHVIARGTDDQSAPPEQEAIDNDDPFSAFFKRTPRQSTELQTQTPGQNPNGPRVMTGSGSGFIVSPDGVVLTTAHVVDNAQEVIVQLTDKREFKAEVVAVDPQSDVAVLQVDAHDLPTVKLGDSSKLRAGEPVLSIGSPDSFENTVTTGIVSAPSRTLPDGNAFPFFQTNVAVNPDNSGGPLFNRAGEVIGIDVQVYADRDRFTGLTFGIPIEAANQFRAQLQAARKTGPVKQTDQTDQADAASAGTRTFGMQVEDVSPGLAAALGLSHAGGALVDTVDADSIGAAAGVKAGDVIVQVGEAPVDSAATLASQLAAVPPATQTPLKLIRNRRPMLASFSNAAIDTPKSGKAAKAAKATVAGKTAKSVQAAKAAPAAQAADQTDEADAAEAPAAAPRDARAVATVDAETDGVAVQRISTAARLPKPHSATTDRLGLTTHALSEDERRSSGLPLGLMVDASSGAAARAGVRPGDIVLSLNDTLIETHEQAMALESKATRSMALLIQRNNARSFVDVKLQ